MARVYSTQLFNLIVPGAGTQLLGTVPASTVWVVRHITAFPQAITDLPIKGFTIFLNSGVVLWANRGPAIPLGQSLDWSGRHVVEAGDAITADMGDATGWSFLGSGYQLALP